MISQTLIFEPGKIISLCAICISDRSGAQIALLIIISSLIVLAAGNWAWKKYFSNKNQRSQQK